MRFCIRHFTNCISGKRIGKICFHDRIVNPVKHIVWEDIVMKAVIVEEYGRAVLKDVPLREVGPEDVKVRIAYCGIGGLDPYIITGEVPLELPWHLGYQASGVIMELGRDANARGLKAGDRVALDQHQFCGSCYNCMHDRQNLCENVINSFMDAMMAEYNVIHQKQAWKIPIPCRSKKRRS